MLRPVGRLLIGTGILLVIAGLVFVLAERMGIRLGNLPGDIRIQGRNGGFYFPVVTCIVISVVVSLILSFFRSR